MLELGTQDLACERVGSPRCKIHRGVIALGNHKRLRLRLAHPVPPAQTWLTAKQARTTLPFAPAPFTEPSPLLREGPPLRPGPPLQFPLLEVLASAISFGPTHAPPANHERGATGSHVPYKSPDHARATFMPDTTWPVNRHRRTHPRTNHTLWF
jgi:hypothetical protein